MQSKYAIRASSGRDTVSLDEDDSEPIASEEAASLLQPEKVTTTASDSKNASIFFIVRAPFSVRALFHRKFSIMLDGHLTVNENGEMIAGDADVSSIRLSCHSSNNTQ